MVEISQESTPLSKMNLNNARESEQIKRMKKLARTGQCHFCRDGFEDRHTAPIIYEGYRWFITANNYPYSGATHHYLIVPKVHITQLGQLPVEAQVGLIEAFRWLEKHLETPGYTAFVRSGDLSYTGATIDHLHFHFLSGVQDGKGTEKLKVTLGYKNKPQE